jgi:hypothetical protein
MNSLEPNEVIELLNKYEINSIDLLEKILRLRKDRNMKMKTKYESDDSFRDQIKKTARDLINNKYNNDESFREKQKERARKRYQEKIKI